MSIASVHLHLVSEQTVPTVLSILALQPERVLLLRSGDERFADTANRIRSAVECAGGPVPEIVDDPLQTIPHRLPGIAATRKRIERLASKYPVGLVNLTCGTKLMSIGAHEFARRAGVPSLYVERDWFSGDSGDLPAMPAIDEVVSRLTVEAVLAANGLNAKALITTVPDRAHLDYGSIVIELMSRDAEAVRRYLAKVRKRLRPENRDPKKSEIDSVLAKGLPDPEDDVQHALLEAARGAGLVKDDGQGKWGCVLRGGTGKPQNRIKETLDVLRDLEGTWYEYACAEEMIKSGAFLDVRVGVTSRNQAESLGETDIVAVDPQARSLVFVSCKVSDKHVKPLEHVFATRQRSIEFGGTFSRTHFCVHSFTDVNKEKALRNACEVLRCRVHAGHPDFAGSERTQPL